MLSFFDHIPKNFNHFFDKFTLKDQWKYKKLIDEQERVINKRDKSVSPNQDESFISQLPQKLILSIFSFLKDEDKFKLIKLNRLFISRFINHKILSIKNRLNFASIGKLFIHEIVLIQQLDSVKTIKLTDTTFKKLFKICPKISKLNLSGCDLRDINFSKFSQSIKTLQLAGCTNVLQINLIAMMELETLDLSWCKWTDTLLLNESIKNLDLSFCELCDDDLKVLPQKLNSLRIVGCSQITDQGIGEIPSKELTNLSVAGCDLLTDKMISNLPLKIISLSLSATKVTNEGIKNLFSRLKKLRYLDLSLCWNVSRNDQIFSIFSSCEVYMFS